MKVLLIAVNQEKHPYPVQPIGAIYIAAALKEKGHQVRLLDLNFVDDFKKDIPLVLNEFKPDLVGISIRNVDNCFYPNMEFYLPKIKEIVNCCKANTAARLVAGGSGFSVMPKEILEYLEMYLGITGNGEEVICDLASRMEEGASIEKVKGIIYRKDEQYFKNPVAYDSYGLDGLEPARFLLALKTYFEEAHGYAVSECVNGN